MTLAYAAMDRGEDPISFIEGIFEEDLARQEGDTDEERQSVAANSELEDEPDFDTYDSEYDE